MFGKQDAQTKVVRTDQKKHIPIWKPEHKGEEPPF